MKTPLRKRLLTVGISLIACFLGTLVGCNDSYRNNGGNNGDGSCETPAKIATPYTADDLGTVRFSDNINGFTIDVSGNTHLRDLLLAAEYYEAPEPDFDGCIADVLEFPYVLHLDGLQLRIYARTEVEFVFEAADKPSQRAILQGDGLGYVFDLTDGSAFAFDGYGEAQKITVLSADKKGGELADKTAFLEKWNALRFVKLKNTAHYQTQTDYTLAFDTAEFTVSGSTVSFDGELYALTQGDFDFFKDLQFKTNSDSGWLPWL